MPELLPKVSVIVTCYNLEKYIEDAISSLLDQDCDFYYEVIIVDDASQDGSVAVITPFLKDPRVKFLPLKTNIGAAAAINLAWKEAKGEYLCRFDGDDKWSPTYLRKASAVLDADPEVVLVHSDVSFIDSEGNITSERNNIPRPLHLTPKDHEFKHILRNYYINAPAIMARKLAWDKVLPWPEAFREGLGDWFCSLRMLEGQYSYFIDQPLAYYRIHFTNMHRSMIVNGAAERNTEKVFQFFADMKELSGRDWADIRFAHYRHLGFSYYAADMEGPALRCLKRALVNKPSAITDAGLLRILLASFMGKKRYELIKKKLRLR